MRKMLIIGMGILFLFSGALSATILNVPSEYSTIQQGIDASQDSDTVLVQPGTYIENVNYNGKNITVGSLFLTSADTSHISQTTIDGNHQGSVVTFESGEDTTTVLCGFTIINGLGFDADPFTGGGINVYKSSPSLMNLIVMNNHSEYMGGGMLLGGSNIELSDIIVKYNSSDAMGGGIGCICFANFINVNVHNNDSGIYCTFSTISMKNVTIENNSPYGGLTSYWSELNLENVTVKGNYSQYAGGGIGSSNTDIFLSEVIVTNNTSADIGGGMYICGDDANLFNTIVENNTAYQGGGIFFRAGRYDIKYSVIANNTSTYTGGGIYSQYDLGNIENSTIVYNSRGGIYGDLIYGLVIKNSIITNNTQDAGIHVYGDCSINYSNFWNNNILGIFDSTGINVTTNANGDSCDIYYNIQMDPMFVDPANQDYHLQWCSPCIDAGDPNSPLDPDSTITDMGAYYYHQDVAIDNPPQNNNCIQVKNFPNPFSTSTKISFSLPHPDKVKIQIYNLKGQLVKTLLDEDKTVGEHSVELYTVEMSSGIYFMKLLTEEKTIIRKLIIIK